MDDSEVGSRILKLPKINKIVEIVTGNCGASLPKVEGDSYSDAGRRGELRDRLGPDGEPGSFIKLEIIAHISRGILITELH